jgi:hypothetical protein
VRTAASDFTALPQIDITQWVTVDEAALPPERLQQFRHHKRAITLYLDGANEAQLLHETGLKRRNVYRFTQLGRPTTVPLAAMASLRLGLGPSRCAFDSCNKAQLMCSKK